MCVCSDGLSSERVRAGSTTPYLVRACRALCCSSACTHRMPHSTNYYCALPLPAPRPGARGPAPALRGVWTLERYVHHKTRTKRFLQVASPRPPLSTQASIIITCPPLQPPSPPPSDAQSPPPLPAAAASLSSAGFTTTASNDACVAACLPNASPRAGPDVHAPRHPLLSAGAPGGILFTRLIHALSAAAEF
jgi:hypothetical protein